MLYGCIGEVLKHSFSKEIHNKIADYKYEIKEVKKDEFDSFMKAKDFVGINVTIPYKEMIIPYLDEVDDMAKTIGAVNTVVNKNGKLYGYNTDFYGMKMLIERIGISLENKKVAILGSGGTSKTANAVVSSLGAKTIIKVSREKKGEFITYDELYSAYNDVEVVINTTPLGMYPNVDKSPVDLSKFLKLQGAVDVVYNPIKTEFIRQAKALGVKADTGLYMLVMQAVKASEIFMDKKYDISIGEKIYSEIFSLKQNVVLTGMPGSGKTTVGKILKDLLNKEFVDTDELIEKKENSSIKEIFSIHGEKYFRELEKSVIEEVSKKNGQIISTGGGAILNEENVKNLKLNGKVFFLDRDVSEIVPTDDRPLSSNVYDLKKRYEERYPLYSSTADVVIKVDVDENSVANKIVRSL